MDMGHKVEREAGIYAPVRAGGAYPPEHPAARCDALDAAVQPGVGEALHELLEARPEGANTQRCHRVGWGRHLRLGKSLWLVHCGAREAHALLWSLRGGGDP